MKTECTQSNPGTRSNQGEGVGQQTDGGGQFLKTPENPEEDPRGARRLLVVFLLLHFMVWTLLPLTQDFPPGDSLETLAWGLSGEWGTNKHPPLTGWLSNAALDLTGNPDLALYAIGQVCVLTAFVFIYLLARRYLTPWNAVLCVLFLEGTIYYSYNATVYNPNVLSLAMTAAVTYYFHEAARGPGKTRHWILTGVFGGLSLLVKYTNGIVLLALALYLFLTPEGRRQLRKSGPYLALAVAVALTLPHVLWLYRYDFQPLLYAQSKVETNPNLLAGMLRRLVIFLVVLFAQPLKAAGTLALFALLYYKTPRVIRTATRRFDPFLLYAGVLPLVITAVSAAMAGIYIYPKYAYAFIGYFPLLLLYRFPVAPAPNIRRLAVILVFVGMAGMAIAAFASSRDESSVDFTSRNFAAKCLEAFEPLPSPPPRYVGGEFGFLTRASAYFPWRPRPLFEASVADTVWESADAVAAGGLLVLAQSAGDYEHYRKGWPTLPEARKIVFPSHARSGREMNVALYFGFAPPSQTGR